MIKRISICPLCWLTYVWKTQVFIRFLTEDSEEFLPMIRMAIFCMYSDHWGSSLGQFKIPVAIDDFGDRYAVLDSELSQIVLFQPTEYGTLITKAVESAFNQDYDSACEYWLQTLKFTSKSELSYSGVGDARYNQGNYSEAMKIL